MTNLLHLCIVPDLDQSGYSLDPFPGSGSEFQKTSLWITDAHVCVPLLDVSDVRINSIIKLSGDTILSAVAAKNPPIMYDRCS